MCACVCVCMCSRWVWNWIFSAYHGHTLRISFDSALLCHNVLFKKRKKTVITHIDCVASYLNIRCWNWRFLCKDLSFSFLVVILFEADGTWTRWSIKQFLPKPAQKKVTFRLWSTLQSIHIKFFDAIAWQKWDDTSRISNWCVRFGFRSFSRLNYGIRTAEMFIVIQIDVELRITHRYVSLVCAALQKNSHCWIL